MADEGVRSAAVHAIEALSDDATSEHSPAGGSKKRTGRSKHGKRVRDKRKHQHWTESLSAEQVIPWRQPPRPGAHPRTGRRIERFSSRRGRAEHSKWG